MDAKKLFRIFVVPSVLVAAVALVMVVPAFADEPCWSDFNLEDCEPEGGTLVIDVTQDVVNDIDSAVGGGYWASDYYTRHIRVWDFFEIDPLVIVQYDGTFVSIEGPSPNDTGLVGAGVTGSMTGGYVAWFYADYLEEPFWPTEGYVGLFDYEGDPETGEVNPVSWLAQYFDEWWDWEYIWWGWRYDPVCPSNGYWINSADGNEGDITGEPDFGCLPPPPAEWVPRYRMVTLIDLDAPDWYYGTGERNGTCWVKMPTEQYLPSVEQQLRICNYDDGAGHTYTSYQAEYVLYDAWVMWNPVTGEVRYVDPLWESDWFDPDYTTH